jgi:DNA-directed RNA polymerase beta subunit
MEKDVFVGHGASLLLKERFGADSTKIHVDKESGDIGYFDRENNKVVKQSGEDGDFEEAEIPHAMLLLLDELKSMMIDVDIDVEEE